MNKEINDYIKKQKSPQKEICQELRRFILETLPGAKEEMKWGVPVFYEGKFYIGAFKNSVNLGFSINGLTEEEKKLFEGSGKTMKHIKFRSLQDIDEEKIMKLLKLVARKSRCEKGC